MSSNGTGFYGPSGEWSAAVPNGFQVFVDVTSYINFIKAGGTDTVPQTVDAPALRSKAFTATQVNTSTTTIAHGCEDEYGNPVVPTAVVQLQGPAAGDIMVSTTAPDATNLYLSASTAGVYNFLVWF